MLTQAEIDALLAAELNAQELPAAQPPEAVPTAMAAAAVPGQGTAEGDDRAGRQRAIRPYNFWSPDLFSKEQLRAVELIHEDLAERLGTTLPAYLRTDLRLRLALVDQGRFDDLVGELPPPTLFNILTLEPLPGHAILVISDEVSWVILERLLGGGGRNENRDSPRPNADGRGGRKLTEIDQVLLRGVVEHILAEMKISWRKIIALNPRLEDSTLHHNRVRILMGSARVALITFELVIQGMSGTINLYIPFSMLKPIAETLNPYTWLSGQEKQRQDEADRQKLREHLLALRVPLCVILGSAEVSMADLVNLSPGDVVRLQTPVGYSLPVHIGGSVRFTAQPGLLGRKLAVRITSAISQGGEM
ncbi:MAG: hypothetical protein C4311_11220 [Chloroflexota bacterium]